MSRRSTGRRLRWAVAACLLPILLAACAASGPVAAPTTTPRTTATTASAPARSSSTARPSSPAAPHVMVVMMENKSYGDVIGQPTQPYTNRLAHRYGLATHSYAFGHPSLPNYLDLVSGSNQGVTDDGPPASHSFPQAHTLADQLAAAGIRRKAYAEDLPADPTSDAGEYAVRHFPWVYFPRTPMPIADAHALLADLRSPRPPAFVWYTPNVIHDEHDGSVEQGDAFLSQLVPKVQSTPWYRAGGQIIIEWDESEGESSGIGTADGGHVPTIVVSAALGAHPRKDATPVDTAGILGSIERCYGVGLLGGAARPVNGNIDGLLRSCATS